MKLTKMQKYGERQVNCSGQDDDDDTNDTNTNVSKMNGLYSLNAKCARYYSKCFMHLLLKMILDVGIIPLHDRGQNRDLLSFNDCSRPCSQ